MKISVNSFILLGCVLLSLGLCSCEGTAWENPPLVSRAAVLGPPTSSIDDGDNNLYIYDTPLEWPVPYYTRQTQYYYGGRLDNRPYYFQGYYYPNRYYYDGVYLRSGERIGGPDTGKYN